MKYTKDYKVFLSYSWTSNEHVKWVYDLAVRLRENGLDVKFDQWDLKPGADKYKFMESMVKDEDIDRVLLICDKGYKEKADTRDGGVGTETQIITPQIYNDARQEKFIPIIAEKIDDEFDSCMPIFIKSRIAIDMSSIDKYEDGYEKLLRLIYERPQFRKPEKGEPPAFLFEDEKSHFKTKNINKQLKNNILNNSNNIDLIIGDFINEFIQELETFKIEYDNFTEPYDEEIYNNIKDMLPLRDDYIEFIEILSKSRQKLDVEVIINLFEEIYRFTESSVDKTFRDIQFDHYKFFITELFLYTIIILTDNNLYEQVDILLSTKYFVKSYHKNGITFDKFRFYIRSLDLRNSRLKLSRISIVADLLYQRAQVQNRNFKQKLLDIDLLLHYISKIKSENDIWFPQTYIYEYERNIEILKKMTVRRHFDKVKVLFNVDTPEEMQSLITDYDSRYSRGYSISFESIPHIKSQINVKDIGRFK